MSQKRQVQSSILSFFKKSPSVSSPTTTRSPVTPLTSKAQDSPCQPSRADASLGRTPVSSAKKPRKPKVLIELIDDETSSHADEDFSQRPSGSAEKESNDIKRKLEEPEQSNDSDSPVVKRRRIRTKSAFDLFSDEEEENDDGQESSGDDNDPDFKMDAKEAEEDEDEEDTSAEIVDENEEPFDEGSTDDEASTPVRNKARGRKSVSSAKSSTRKAFQSIPRSASKGKSNVDANSQKPATAEWPPLDEDYKFLRGNQIKDRQGRRKFMKDSKEPNPDYDPTTLEVPELFLAKQTEAQRQWWQLKSQHFDTVLFFKVGKFYELFHMDALIGIQELNLLPMGGSFYHSGFPEKSFMKFADILREKGYRVARVEQTESNEARDARIKSKGRSAGPHVVRREICQIITPGTSCYSTEVNFSAPRLLMAIHQKKLDDGHFRFGVAFLDSTISKFTLSQFTDDKYCSKLRTLLAYNQPIEILLEKNNLTHETDFVLNTWYRFVHKRTLLPEKQFLSAKGTLEMIRARGYFDKEQECEYPTSLKMLCDECDSTYLTPNDDYVSVTRAFGALLWYLKDCLIDEEIVTVGKIEFYQPPDAEVIKESAVTSRQLPPSMILDASTLSHLDIVDSELGVKYSLLGFLDYTSTRFGKRMFRSWICSPSTDIETISSRLDAIDDLENFYTRHSNLFTPLASLPDLEKLLTQIHKVGLKRKDHPDDRAQMFEDYDKAKVKALLQSLDGLKKITALVEDFSPHVGKFKSSVLKKVLTPVSQGGLFPELKQVIRDFEGCIDLSQAKKSLIIVPSGEWDPELVEVNHQAGKIESQLENLRKFYSSSFGCQVKYSHAKKERYLIEVKSNCVNKVDKKKFNLVNSTKTVSRYSNPEVNKLAEKLKVLEDKKESLSGDTKRKLFAKFSRSMPLFIQAVNCISSLDCYLSLTKAKTQMECITDKVTRPIFDQKSPDPYIEVVGGKHPILMQLNESFVPNDLLLKADKMIILTGPNMGGKSTLMRQTALLAIMAQVGSYVPAKSLSLTPVDRVFTRIGAYDNIAAGDSTFKVEMDEASAIVKNATVDSLILMDELGRGTSTHDGTAIAHAVVKYLSSRLKCRTLFSTHYHDLVEGLLSEVNIQSCHMKCLEQMDPKSGVEQIVFMYKVAPGECPKSHGFNAARLAGLPEKLISLAKEKAQEMHKEAQVTSNIRNILKQVKQSDTAQLRLLLRSLNISA